MNLKCNGSQISLNIDEDKLVKQEGANETDKYPVICKVFDEKWIAKGAELE